MIENFPITKETLITLSGNEIKGSYQLVNDTDFSESDANNLFTNALNNSYTMIISIKVSDVYTDEEDVFNEEYLLHLRKILLQAPENINIFFLPILQESDNTKFNYQTITACMKHTARRSKKFTCIKGFVLPLNDEFKTEKVRQYFTDELSQKHDYQFIQNI